MSGKSAVFKNGMLILMDVEALMRSPGMGLIDALLEH